MYILYIYIKVYKNDYIKSYDKLNFLQKFATTGRGRYQRSPIFWEKNLEFFFRPKKSNDSKKKELVPLFVTIILVTCFIF